MASTPPIASIDLYWLPLGAGGHSVRLNGKVFEAVAARLDRRDVELELDHLVANRAQPARDRLDQTSARRTSPRLAGRHRHRAPAVGTGSLSGGRLSSSLQVQNARCS